MCAYLYLYRTLTVSGNAELASRSRYADYGHLRRMHNELPYGMSMLDRAFSFASYHLPYVLMYNSPPSAAAREEEPLMRYASEL